MSKVIDLQAKRIEREPHSQGEAVCLHCKHTWMAIVPQKDFEECCDLECPECHTMRGVYRYNYSVPAGEPLWQCNCGNDYFVVGAESVICAKCGTETEYQNLFEDP